MIGVTSCSPEDTVPELAAPPEPEPSETPTTIETPMVIDLMANVYDIFSRTDTVPDYVVLERGDTVYKAEYFGYGIQVVIDLYRGNADRALRLTKFILPEDPDIDGFMESTVSLEMVVNYGERQLNWANTHDYVWGNYAGYPGTFGSYNGNFSFNRGVVVTARVLDYYKRNNALPAEVSSSYKEEIPVDPAFVRASDAINALALAYTEFESSNTIPDTITINGIKYGKSQYVEMAARIIQDTGIEEIEIHNYQAPSDPDNPNYDTFTLKDGSPATTIPFDLVQNAITRKLPYASTNGMFPNYAGYPSASYKNNDDTYKGYFSYNRFVVVLARTISYYKLNGSIPDTIAATYK
jgi:hypothetical protein